MTSGLITMAILLTCACGQEQIASNKAIMNLENAIEIDQLVIVKP
jgi:hypothetical protein